MNFFDKKKIMYAFYSSDSSANRFLVRFHIEMSQHQAPFEQTKFFGKENIEALTILLVIFKF